MRSTAVSIGVHKSRSGRICCGSRCRMTGTAGVYLRIYPWWFRIFAWITRFSRGPCTGRVWYGVFDLWTYWGYGCTLFSWTWARLKQWSPCPKAAWLSNQSGLPLSLNLRFTAGRDRSHLPVNLGFFLLSLWSSLSFQFSIRCHQLSQSVSICFRPVMHTVFPSCCCEAASTWIVSDGINWGYLATKIDANPLSPKCRWSYFESK